MGISGVGKCMNEVSEGVRDVVSAKNNIDQTRAKASS